MTGLLLGFLRRAQLGTSCSTCGPYCNPESLDSNVEVGGRTAKKLPEVIVRGDCVEHLLDLGGHRPA
jgi:hypothetical protein